MKRSRRLVGLVGLGAPPAAGRLLDEHWRTKKQLSSKISFSKVDRLYERVKTEYSVLGGKVIGAGEGEAEGNSLGRLENGGRRPPPKGTRRPWSESRHLRRPTEKLPFVRTFLPGTRRPYKAP